MNIVTSLCIDLQDDSFNFQLYHLNNVQKRITYWECCVTFFATVHRCHPEFKKILYTNDEREIIHKNIDIKELLTQFEVEIVYLPFQELEKYRSVAKYLFPTLYKFLVIKEISKREGYSMFFDSDCVWTKPINVDFFDISKPLLYNVYQKSDIYDKRFNDLSMAEMGNVFRVIEPEYPAPAPILFGGEIIGGEMGIFKQVVLELDKYLNKITKSHLNLCFSNGKSILDGDEFLASMVYNKIFKEYQEADGFIKRTWTYKKVNNTDKRDLQLTVWHVISEKLKGIPLLFDQIINRNSDFWNTPLSEFNIYLGSYLNIPKRKIKINPLVYLKILIQKIMFKLKQLAHRFKFMNFF